MAKTPYCIELSADDRKYLASLSKSRTTQAQVVDRARILLQKEKAVPDKQIADGLGIAVNTVRLCIQKYLENGVDAALSDVQRKGRPSEITSDAVAWITSIACQRPIELGFAQELWTLKSLHSYIQSHAVDAGYPRLETITKARVQQILKASDIKPFKIKYYCERRDPDFEEKMHDVLLVYKQIEMQFDEQGNLLPFEDQVVHTLSYDEKPGIQAIATTTPDLRPTADSGVVLRDYEYKRLGTLSLLAAIDLLTGEAIPLVSETHKSSDFIAMLKMLDEKYPNEDTIRLILDNHSAHTSREVQNYLAKMPENRFKFVFTPKHGSWLNMIESFFSKMTKQMLRGIRVDSKEELEARIYKYFNEINEEPVIYHWKYKMDEISQDEARAV
jgi:transposase